MKEALHSRTDAGEPLTLCSLRVGDGLYGIDTRLIREVLGTVTPRHVPLAPMYIAGVVPYHGEVLTTVCFRALLGLQLRVGANCVVVFDDERNEQRFGLIVDGVGGVIAVQSTALEANSSGLDPRSMELFDGSYKLPSGLLVRLDPRKLRPSHLAGCGLFATLRQERQGVQECGR